MLVLTRRPGEQIVIGDGIRVTVVSVGPGRVKIGIDAPANVRIDRQEVHEKIQHEQAEQSSDVLAMLGRGDADGASPTMVSSASGDTMTILREHLAEQAAKPVAAATAPTPVAVGATDRTAKPRLFRKPR